MRLHKWKDIDWRGTVERVNYETIDQEGKPYAKYANVYLPYGYDASKKYDILYLMHGGGGNPDAWLDCSQVKNVLDSSFFEKEEEPFIVVFPTFYDLCPSIPRRSGVSADWENTQVRYFQKEFREELIPAIEKKYSTYAENLTPEGLKRSREHRAFGGFSMGGATTWYVFLNSLDYVSRFMPLSGDCWAVKPTGGKLAPTETAKLLYDHVISSGYSKSNFNIFCGTGSKDIAVENLSPMLEEMKKYTDVFEYSEDSSKGNLHFNIMENAVHAYEDVYHHLYNYIQYIFK